MGEAKDVLPKFVTTNKVGGVITDFCPLRVPLKWLSDVSKKLPDDVPLCQVNFYLNTFLTKAYKVYFVLVIRMELTFMNETFFVQLYFSKHNN